MSDINPEKVIPTSNSTAQEWIQWHKALDSYLGLKKANYLFTIAWSKRGGTSVRGNTSELRNYLKDKGLSIETNGIQDLTDFTENIGDKLGTMFTIGKWATISIFAVAIGGAALLIYSVAKKPERLLLATPQGRLGAALKG